MQQPSVEINQHTQAHVLIIQARCWSICNNLMLTQAMMYPIVVKMTIAPVQVCVEKSPPKACRVMMIVPALLIRDRTTTA